MSAMPTRRFGRTELPMPVFTCGGMRAQQSWEDIPEGDIPADNQKNFEAIVHRALELGINHFETARGYGSSEVQYGRVLPTLPRDDILVQTKIGPPETTKEFLDTFETSMSNLNLEYLDLLSVHGINTSGILERIMRKGGILDAMKGLKKDGRIRHIGWLVGLACRQYRRRGGRAECRCQQFRSKQLFSAAGSN